MTDAAPPPQGSEPAATAAERAAALVERMSDEQLVALLHAPMGMPIPGYDKPEGALGSAGYTPGIEALGIPALQETDASLGVANPGDVRPGASATALPSGTSLAAAFDPQLAGAAGRAIGVEARAAGFGVLLAGGVNLTREPRCGRNFEYLGEDALLAGTVAGASIAGIQSQGVISTVKHLVLNAQESGRMVISSDVAEAAARESDLLAFEIAIGTGRPLSVMCAYNRYNGEHCSQSRYLLTTFLREQCDFDGYVMSDWGGTHSTVASVRAGLDRQSGANLDTEEFFGAPLLAAVRAGDVPLERLREMARRVLGAMFAAGLFDARDDVVPDLDAHAAFNRGAAAQGMVLLRNDGVLPLRADVRSVLVVGRHVTDGVLSGGGSSQVRPPGSLVLAGPAPGGHEVSIVHHPSPVPEALRAALPGVAVSTHDGVDVAAAADAARAADVVIVVAEQWTSEFLDVPDLALPDEQDTLITALAAANPRTVVVLTTGGPVLLPWRADVAAILAAWYPGGEGGAAIADVLSGAAEPGGRLPVTFPVEEGQLPRPVLRTAPLAAAAPQADPSEEFAEDYDIEGADVGYRWFLREGHEPLYWFGAGLTYTTFELSDLQVGSAAAGTASVRVTNTGERVGTAVPQLYVELPATTPRLAGWARVVLEPGASVTAEFALDHRVLSRWDVTTSSWSAPDGDVEFSAGLDAGHRTLRRVRA